jgi:hypothetical protein
MNPNDEIINEPTEAEEEILPEEADEIAGGGAGYGDDGSQNR